MPTFVCPDHNVAAAVDCKAPVVAHTPSLAILRLIQLAAVCARPVASKCVVAGRQDLLECRAARKTAANGALCDDCGGHVQARAISEL